MISLKWKKQIRNKPEQFKKKKKKTFIQIRRKISTYLAQKMQQLETIIFIYPEWMPIWFM